MKLTHYLSAGLLSLALLSGAGLAQAKPELHDLEKLLPHNQIKRHIEHKADKGRRFYNDDHRSHPDKKHTKHDRHGKYGQRDKHHKYDRHYRNKHDDRYYNGWNQNYRHHSYKHKRHYGQHDRRFYQDYRHSKFSSSFWGDHHRHGYRHKRYNGHHYYYNQAGFFFPGLGLIKHGHRHGRHCPDWHLEPIVAGVILSAILNR